jgi:hypothetical protein
MQDGCSAHHEGFDPSCMHCRELYTLPDDPKAGDKAPGGGLIGEVGTRAEMFLSLIVGKQGRGAIVTGRRVRKVNSEPGDRTPNGQEGRIIGSVGPFTMIIEGHVANYGYMIKWDGDERPVFTTDGKVVEL